MYCLAAEGQFMIVPPSLSLMDMGNLMLQIVAYPQLIFITCSVLTGAISASSAILMQNLPS
jgi:hypothetical protein